MTIDQALAKARSLTDSAVENNLEDFRILLLDKGFDADRGQGGRERAGNHDRRCREKARHARS
jgi:hypothetical protein